MTPYFLLCAEKAARTVEGSLVLHGVIERLVTKEVPTAEKPFPLPTLGIAFEVRDIDMTKPHAVRVQLTHRETKTALFDHTMRVDASPDAPNKVNGVLNLHLLPLQALGAYEYSLEIDGALVAANYFSLLQAATPSHG